jgi:hypothetical protein
MVPPRDTPRLAWWYRDLEAPRRSEAPADAVTGDAVTTGAVTGGAVTGDPVTGDSVTGERA